MSTENEPIVPLVLRTDRLLLRAWRYAIFSGDDTPPLGDVDLFPRDRRAWTVRATPRNLPRR